MLGHTVGIVQLRGLERPGGDRQTTNPVRARTGDVAWRVADHDRRRAWVRDALGTGPPPGDRGQHRAILRVRAETALAAREVAAEPGPGEFEAGDGLEVARDERQPGIITAVEPLQQRRDARDDRVGQ